jgi:hypothetical protein
VHSKPETDQKTAHFANTKHIQSVRKHLKKQQCSVPCRLHLHAHGTSDFSERAMLDTFIFILVVSPSPKKVSNLPRPSS